MLRRVPKVRSQARRDSPARAAAGPPFDARAAQRAGATAVRGAGAFERGSPPMEFGVDAYLLDFLFRDGFESGSTSAWAE